MFVLAWTSGHLPPRTMYFTETQTGWCAGEILSEAKQFKTPKGAIAMWRSKLAYPDERHYVEAIRSGRVRAERVEQIGLNL